MPVGPSSKQLDSTPSWLIGASVAAQGILTPIIRLRMVRRRGNAHAAAAAHVQYPASYAVAPSAPANNVSPLAEYDVEGSGNSGSEDSDAPFARADAAAAAAASAASGGSPSTDAVPSGDGGVADEEEGEGDEPEDEDDDGEVGGSYSDVDGDSDPEDSAIRCVTFDALDGRSLTKPSGTK